jgi:3-oxoacyl-[acyl-carrier-protein] synthase II
MNQQQRVAVTGLGLVSPFGGDLSDFFARLLAGESAVSFLRTADVPRPLATPFVFCRDFDADARLGRPLAGLMDRFSQLGVAAAFDAWEDAGFVRGQPPKVAQNCGVAWGTALGGVLAYEQGYRDLWLAGRARVAPLSVVIGMNNAANAHISIQLGLGGVSMTYSVACASSAIAIGEAFRRVRSGEAPVMLAGGSESPQAYAVVRAWDALRVLANGDERRALDACRPFSAERSGLVLGEGGAALVLEAWDHALARGARIYAEMIGYGSSSDHSHLVRPAVDGQQRAIAAALNDAGLPLAAVDYVNAHGTATTEGDTVEVAALRAVFGQHAERLAVSATKSMHGHQLGAAGALEAIITVLALDRQAIPPTAHLSQIDPACQGVDHVVCGRPQQPLRAALSSSFAFGGSNAVLAFRAATH